MATEEQVLERFFGAYFHQDWMGDHSAWQQVVKKYLSDVDGGESEALQELVEFDFIRSVISDQELGEKMLALGCYYDPSADGMTTREWLKAVVAQIVGK